MEERKEFKTPEVVSYDREELAFKTAFMGGDPSDQQPPSTPGGG